MAYIRTLQNNKNVIACPMVFSLLSGRGAQEEVLKLIKDDLFLSTFSCFP